ncbi:hypothetical protein AX774_g4151 [Zancudomyces culisetae]|uniref:Uncharacterized protein n=1 Tax=Zancudomyces culisetae TaxID=1213189 RepID=A0A1R1PGJ2_ZANCU|nr:hypothetical protein AX774_g6482 [Zancudomyces culisetae]OMH82375.1 hypothetical protein AX774_g4151 [Zancudomyces culisetae]|eukprot:OMH80096.1 hypothetical protein AX774_g6482 [Zancudomyces culisetae]
MTRLGRKLCQNRELLPISLSQHKRVPLISTAEGLNNEIELDELFDELVGGVDGKFEDQDDSMSDIHTKISITSEDSVKDAILSKEPSKSAATIAAPESSSNTEKAALIKKQDTNSNNQAKNTDHNTLLYESHDWDGDSNWDLESNSDSQNQNP